MYNIVLLCQYGASTGLVANKIKEAADARGIAVTVNAYSAGAIADVIDKADIILLGPQVRFRQKGFQKDYGDRGVPIIAMEPTDYGRLNGEGILNTALAELEKNA